MSGYVLNSPVYLFFWRKSVITCSIQPLRSRLSWRFPHLRLVHGLVLWIPQRDLSHWRLRALRVKACGLRVSVRFQVEIEESGVRIRVNPPRSKRAFVLDELCLRAAFEPFDIEPAVRVVESEELALLREEMITVGRQFKIGMYSHQGYGDIFHALICQWLLLRLVDLPLKQGGAMLLVSHGADSARGKATELIGGFVSVLEAWPVSEVDALPLKGIDVYADSAPPINRISLLMDDFVSRLLLRSPLQSDPPVSGGVRLLELLLDALAGCLHSPDRWPAFARRLGRVIQSDCGSSLFFQADGAVQADEASGLNSSPSGIVVCQQRLGDLAVVKIGGLELVPWFVDQYQDRYFEVLAAEASQARRPVSSLGRLLEIAEGLHPGMNYQLITDGYALAERLLLKPVNLGWVAAQLGVAEAEAEVSIRREIQILQAQLATEAAQMFSAGAVIGDSAEQDLLSLQALRACDVCISTSGHFCFSIMNFLSHRRQLLHAQPMGRRFDLVRRGLKLQPFSPQDLQ